MKYKKIVTAVFVLFVLLLFFQLFRVARNHSQSYRFGDEDAHMLAGHLILKGYVPYQDFSGNHQPLIYLFSAAVQKIAPPNTLFPFVGRHRLAIFMYSLGWQAVFLYFFGWLAIFFTIVFEILKYLLLGNKVLGETIAMYPFVCLVGFFIKQELCNIKLNKLELILFSLASFFATFSLFPIWPSIVILNFYIFLKNFKNIKKIIYQLLPFFICTIILFLFIPIKDYIQNTVIDNFSFVIPEMNKVSYNTDLSQKILLPFDIFFSKPNTINITGLFFGLFYIFLFFLAVKSKKISAFLILIIALFLANTRSIILKPGDFHILPWLAAYLAIPIIYLSLLKQVKAYTFFFILLVGFSFWLIFINKNDFYGRILLDINNDLSREHYINYSKSVKNGLGIKSIMKKGDRIFGIANDTLAIWVADGDLTVPPLESFRWQYELPRFRKQITDVFNKNPPEFFLMDSLAPLDGSDPISKIVVESLKKNYIQANHLDKPSELFVLKSKLNEVSESQWKEFNYYLFSKP